MNKLKNIIIIVLVIVFALVIFFVFHVPDSPESRVKEISKIIEIYELEEAKDKVEEYFNQYSDEEKLEIFANLPFEVLKENRQWLVVMMNKSLPAWKEDDCFNARYLLTEFELEEKRNMRVIKNLDTFEIEQNYSDISILLKDIYKFSKDKWELRKESFYVVDNSLNVIMNYENDLLVLDEFEIKVFDIINSYIFNITYKDNILKIVPSVDKFEDNGAFELSEKINFYEIDRFLEYIKSFYDINTSTIKIVFSDKLIDAPISVDEGNERVYLNILYNKSQIYELVDISDLRYIGSIRIVFEAKKPDTKSKEEPQNIEFMLNLFKDM